MSAQNGTAYRPLLRLGDLTPETRPVEIVRDGVPVTLAAFVDGSRCPGFVKAKVSAARSAYRRLVYADGPPDEHGIVSEVYVPDDLAWDQYLRDVLMAVLDGLTYPEAEVLAGNQELAIETLKATGWVRAEEGADDSPPPTEPESSTTAGSSHDSPRPTGSRRKRS